MVEALKARYRHIRREKAQGVRELKGLNVWDV